MKNLISFLILTLLLVPGMALAAGEDLHADSVVSASNQVLNPNNILGTPNGTWTDFLMKDATLLLDMGAGELGTGDLKLYYFLFDTGTQYWVDFLDENQLVLDSHGDFLPVYQSVTTVPYDGTKAYRFVRIRSLSNETMRIDAIESAGFEGVEVVPEEPEAESPLEEEEDEEIIPQGLLVTLPDDGNPNTNHDEAVYVIGEDGKRHAFPSQDVYFSWYENFDDVALIDEANLAAYQLGANVTMRPGTYLVKVTNNPKTYAVEPGGILRHIANESIAIELYGEDWADRVRDIPDVFWTAYTEGDPIDSALHPSGTIGELPDGMVVYINNAATFTLGGSAYQDMRIQSMFQVQVIPEIAALYPHSGNLNISPDIRFPR